MLEMRKIDFADWMLTFEVINKRTRKHPLAQILAHSMCL